MKDHAVLIVGAGPTGLMLAGELALARVDVAIVERRAGQDLAGLRAGGLHIRTLEMLDQRGLVDRFLASGQCHRIAPFARTMLDLSDLPTRHNYFLGLWQTHVERLLGEWVRDLGVPIYQDREVVAFESSPAGVDVRFAGGTSRHAQYLVGCDGGRSVIRKQAGIEFPGWEASTSYLIAEIETKEEPAWGIRRTARGIQAIGKLENERGARVVLSEPQIGERAQPTLEELRATLIDIYGRDFGLRGASYLSRFTDMARQAANYRQGRVLLAGDAAHVHSPVGGQGLNLGLQDAMNLGWKLARVVTGGSTGLLDSYHHERHPVGARVLRNTLALTALDREEDRNDALRDMITDLMKVDAARKHYVAMISGLDIHYDLGAGHPLLGRRMPDVELSTVAGPVRMYSLLRRARPVLVDLAGTLKPDARVDRVQASHDGAWELPAIGIVEPPKGVLVRPDGYVAWVGDGSASGLDESLKRWFGPANSART